LNEGIRPVKVLSTPIQRHLDGVEHRYESSGAARQPNGLRENSEGQRPGKHRPFVPKALKGRNNVPFLGSKPVFRPVGALFIIMEHFFPGRCPGLFPAAPSALHIRPVKAHLTKNSKLSSQKTGFSKSVESDMYFTRRIQ